jgi:uncharacterized protein YkwD
MTNRRLRRAISALPVALALAMISAPTAPAATACAAADSSPAVGAAQLEHTVLCLVNRERTSRGFKSLRSDHRLATAARRHSRNMAFRKFFDHNSPGGATLLDRVKRAGYRGDSRGLYVGENIAWGSGSYATPIEIVDGWMRSSGHRANILRREFTEIGVGVALGAPRPVNGMEAAIYTTDFGR